MQASSSRAPDAAAPLDAARMAFRDLHARRLHGFALLLTLGDRPIAARLASHALLAGGAHIGELRHPERAAAWLRARVVRAARGMGGRLEARRGRAEALDELGVDPGVLVGLEALNERERAALIATAIERLDRRDAATVLGMDGQGFDRLVVRARRRYAAAYAGASAGASLQAGAGGQLGERVRAVAERALR